MHESATEGDKIFEDGRVAIVETECESGDGVVGIPPENLPLRHGNELEDRPLPIPCPGESEDDIVWNPQAFLEEERLQSPFVEPGRYIGAEN